MNLREQQYLTGASHLVRVLYLRGGRRVVVLDRIRRRRQAIKRLLEIGHREIDIARVLHCEPCLIEHENRIRK